MCTYESGYSEIDLTVIFIIFWPQNKTKLADKNEFISVFKFSYNNNKITILYVHIIVVSK